MLVMAETTAGSQCVSGGKVAWVKPRQGRNSVMNLEHANVELDLLGGEQTFESRNLGG